MPSSSSSSRASAAGLSSRSTGTWWYGTPDALDRLAQIGVVGRHEHDVPVELGALPAVQQVHEAVVVAGHEHRDALALAGVPQPPGHVEAVGDAEAEPLGEALAPFARERELHPEEERAP